MPDPEQRHTEHPYQMFGGFLWFFLVRALISFVSIVIIAIMLFRNRYSLYFDWPLAATLIFMVARIAIEAIFLVQLLYGKPTFLTVFHVMALLNCVFGLLASLPLESARIITSLLPAILSLVLFHLYFTRSVRVRTYMGTDAYITQCPFTRKVMPPTPAVPDLL